MVKCSVILCALLRAFASSRAPLLYDSREDAKSLVEMHAIEVKGNRHLTFHPHPAPFKHTRKDSFIDRFE